MRRSIDNEEGIARIGSQRRRERNRVCLAFKKLLKSTAVLRKAQLTIYGAVLTSVVMCGL